MPPDIATDVDLIQRIAVVPRILSVCLTASGMGVVAIARVTPDRWTACAVLDRMAFGLVPGSELPVNTTLCGQVRDSHVPIVIEHASREAEWCDHETPRTYGYESHISVPIILPDGSLFGTLVAIDPKPLPVRAPDTVATFALFAELLGVHIDAQQRLDASEGLLAGEREDAALREQFIAVLGHDLRNPLAAIDAGTRLLGREELSERGRNVLTLLGGSVRRMAGLVDDVLDFARGRLAGGIPMAMTEGADLGPTLRQIVEELRGIFPTRVIETAIGPLAGIRCDPGRLGQMLSNLLSNALTHGAPDEPIRVEAEVKGGLLTFDIANGGPPIPEAVLARVFEPFVRGEGRRPEEGLGLGLFIASEIARAHGGTLSAESGASGTRLVFSMPVATSRERVAVAMAS